MFLSLLGVILIGLALGNLYLVFDAKETPLDIFSLFVAGLAGSMGIVSIYLGLRR